MPTASRPRCRRLPRIPGETGPHAVPASRLLDIATCRHDHWGDWLAPPRWSGIIDKAASVQLQPEDVRPLGLAAGSSPRSCCSSASSAGAARRTRPRSRPRGEPRPRPRRRPISASARNARGSSCCCDHGPAPALPVPPPSDVPSSVGLELDASPCLNAAPCGESGLPTGSPGSHVGKAAALAMDGPPGPEGLRGFLTAPSSHILPARRASRLDEPPEGLPLA